MAKWGLKIASWFIWTGSRRKQSTRRFIFRYEDWTHTSVMNFQANFYKLTRTGRISTRSSLESPRAPRALTCACENFQDPVPRRSIRRTTISPQPVSCDDVGAGLIMSPTRNRNFVRRVLDKNEAPDSFGVCTQPRVGKEQGRSRAANEGKRNLLFRRARSRGEITRCHTPFVARLFSGLRILSDRGRHGFSPLASGPRSFKERVSSLA